MSKSKELQAMSAYTARNVYDEVQWWKKTIGKSGFRKKILVYGTKQQI